MKPSPTMPKPAPKPGVYTDVPAEEYHSWAAVSSSLLKEAFWSAAKARVYLNTPTQASSALCIGTCIDIAITDPENYADKVQFIKRAEGSGKDTWQKAVDEYGTRAIAPLDWEAKIERIVRNVLADEACVKLLSGTCYRQLVVVWKDKQYGLTCKAMLDLVRTDLEQLYATDVKTTARETDTLFASDVANLGYDIQMAHYLVGLEQAAAFDPKTFKKEAPPVWSWLTIEKSKAFEPCVFTDEQDEAGGEATFHDCGKARRSVAMAKLAYAIAKNKWQGKSQGLEWPIRPPKWLASFAEMGGNG